jgi:16S rRNA processing protein RimM
VRRRPSASPSSCASNASRLPDSEAALVSGEVPGAESSEERIVILGKLGGPYGLHGWMHVHSFSDPPENILSYGVWRLERGGRWSEIKIEDGRLAGSDVQVKLAGLESPERAREWSGAQVGVLRSEMPPLEPGEYYWTDLEGLDVLSSSGERLGRLERFDAHPVHPLMVIRGEREHLVPFVKERILKVDLAARQIVVDWSADW